MAVRRRAGAPARVPRGSRAGGRAAGRGRPVRAISSRAARSLRRARAHRRSRPRPRGYDQDAHPEAYGVDRAVDDVRARARRAPRSSAAMPTLAICRGLQVLNVALGGTLHQHILELPGVEPPRPTRRAERRGEHHDVDVEAGSLLATVVRHRRASPASCHHHQAVDKRRRRAARHRHARTTASSKALELDRALACSRCSGTPRTPPGATRSQQQPLRRRSSPA